MARPSAVAALSDDRLHLDGCPRNVSRIETYTATDPKGRALRIVRCVDCGGQASNSGAASAAPASDAELEGDDA